MNGDMRVQLCGLVWHFDGVRASESVRLFGAIEAIFVEHGKMFSNLAL